jgi:2,3-bisphosphoglycerate-independent phosphoglycerate mutase
VRDNKKQAVVLCIMDGWGINKNSEHNAVALANTPNVDYLTKTYPHSTLDASGEHVGLPLDQVGNSEVGHMNLGSGRVIIQTLPKINSAFKNDEIRYNKNFIKFVSQHKKGKNIHLLGLCSDGGVHSHIDHIIEISKLLNEYNINCVLHIFSDGRDSSPKQFGDIIEKFESSLPKNIRIGTLIGRYFAMDRDNRWDRVKKSFDLIAYGKHERKTNNISSAINLAYNNNETDEFISPTLIGNYSGIENDDSLMMINFRADRVRELLSAFLDPKFNKFKKNDTTPLITNSLGMTEYSKEISTFMESIFVREEINNTLGDIISKANLTQLRLAETEKYPHVTFFFNGGSETICKGETRIMIPSPRVSTYDLKPEMSAEEVEFELIKAIKYKMFDLIIINFANPDMVGHTGNLKAAIKAVERVDKAIGNIKDALDETKYIMLLTADHGNCEIMLDLDTKMPHTSHTCSKVPLIMISPEKHFGLKDGKLADIAPTILEIMSLDIPVAMNGKSLLVTYNHD